MDRLRPRAERPGRSARQRRTATRGGAEDRCGAALDRSDWPPILPPACQAANIDTRRSLSKILIGQAPTIVSAVTSHASRGAAAGDRQRNLYDPVSAQAPNDRVR